MAYFWLLFIPVKYSFSLIFPFNTVRISIICRVSVLFKIREVVQSRYNLTHHKHYGIIVINKFRKHIYKKQEKILEFNLERHKNNDKIFTLKFPLHGG